MVLFREQRRLSSFFCIQPAPTAAAQQATAERVSAIQQDITEEIADKQERIAELRKEIGGSEEDIAIIEADELEFEPDKGEETIYNAAVPRLEEELTYLRAENEEEIRALEFEIGELEEKLK